MWGTLLNAVTVLVGSTLGLMIGGRLPARIQESVITGLGLVTAYVGVSNAGETGNVIIPLIALVTGVIAGELLALDARLEGFAAWVHARFERQNGADTAPDGLAVRRARFIQGFVTASLVFCVGPLTILGSLQNGLTGDIQLLAIKSLLDGVASIAFAAALGPGVALAALTVLVVQGAIAAAASLLAGVLDEVTILAITSAGGVMLLGVALRLLDLKPVRAASFLPALVLAPIFMALAAAIRDALG